MEAGAAAVDGVGGVPGRSGMATRILPSVVMSKPARLPAGNGTEAGYHACGSLRVTVQLPPAAWCPLAVVAQIWQRVPGGMPLTLASSSVPQGCGV